MKRNLEFPVAINKATTEKWAPAMEAYFGTEAYQALGKRKGLVAALAEAHLIQYVGSTEAAAIEAYMMPLSQANNINLAPDVQNPTVGAHNQVVAKAGQQGSGDKAYLLGVCVSLAAKTIGTEVVQTIPVTSQNVTVKYLDVTYDGGKTANAGNEHMHVVTINFAANMTTSAYLKVGGKYVIGHEIAAAVEQTPAKWEFMEMKYIRPDRTGGFIFELGASFEASKTDLALTNVTYINAGNGIGTLAADGSFFEINADMDTLSHKEDGIRVAETTAVENYVPNQTTRGLNRLLTREEADGGTDRSLGLKLHSEAYAIHNRVITGDISRLDYKRLQESGYDPLPYLLSACKNEFAQEINLQIICAVRAYGWSNAVQAIYNGTCFNTYIGPKAVTSITVASLRDSESFRDKNDVSLASQLPDIQNLQNTMTHENIESIGMYLAMLIMQAAAYIGQDSRAGEGDGVILSSNYVAFLSACKTFTKLNDKDIDMTNATGAKLSGYINGIKVYTDLQVPAGYPVVTVFRSNQDVKIDMPGIEEDTILAPGLAYLVKDVISTTQLVPEKNGGQKLICDSETDVIEVGKRPESAYLSFIFQCALPGLSQFTA